MNITNSETVPPNEWRMIGKDGCYMVQKRFAAIEWVKKEREIIYV